MTCSCDYDGVRLCDSLPADECARKMLVPKSIGLSWDEMPETERRAWAHRILDLHAERYPWARYIRDQLTPPASSTQQTPEGGS